MYDLIVIGAGPAGITASIYAIRKKMKILILTGDVGGQTNWSAGIENYTGYQFIPGFELVKRFRQHLDQYNAEVKEQERVTSIDQEGGIFKVTTTAGAYESKTVVIASGRSHRKLGVPGEDRLRGHGVAYCATCDAPLFADMDVAVIGGGNSALDATLQLVNIARKIYLIDAGPQFIADPVMLEKARESEKVLLHNNAKIREIIGDKFVSAMVLEHEGVVREVPVEGVFIEIGSAASSDFAKDVCKNVLGEILVNCRCETNIPGIFAAGDVTNVPAKQIIVACGEGAKAALAAFEYISLKPDAEFAATAATT